MADRKCGHAGCGCVADPGSDFCSTQCQTANGSAGKTCPCGHDVCKEGHPVARGGTADGSYDPAMSKQVKEKPLLDDWAKAISTSFPHWHAKLGNLTTGRHACACANVTSRRSWQGSVQ